MTISLKLLDSVKNIENKVNEAMAAHANSQINRNYSRTLATAKKYVGMWIAEQPEMQSITGGGLAGHLGIRKSDASGLVVSVVEAVAMATEFKFSKFDKKMRGKAELNFQPSHFANLLALPQSFINTAKNTKLHWLDWLLTQGNRAIIVGYEYVPQAGKGRSGMGTMKAGKAWRVPPEFAGYRDDNFITRAFINKEQDRAKLFKDALER